MTNHTETNALHSGADGDRSRPCRFPIYQQLKTLLVDGILERRYTPDDRLPTEHELCELHGISRTPVNRALSELAAEGVILRHRRRGSFVNPLWLGRRRDDTELRVVVPAYGPWEQLIRDAADGVNLNVVRVPRDALHRVLTPRRRRRPGTRPRRVRPRLGAGVRAPPASSIRSTTSTRGGSAESTTSTSSPRSPPPTATAARRSASRRSPRWPVCGSTGASCGPSTSMLRRRGASCAARPGRCRPAQPARAAGAPRWHRRRRDHLLLPDRVPRLQRRQRARVRRHRCRIGGDRTDAALPAPARHRRLPPAGRRRLRVGPPDPPARRRSGGDVHRRDVRGRDARRSAPVPDRSGVWDHFGFAPIPAGPQRASKPASPER